MDTDRELTHLADELFPKAHLFLALIAKLGIRIAVCETWRSAERQLVLYHDGATHAPPGQSPHEVCKIEGGQQIPKACAFDIYGVTTEGHLTYDVPWRTIEAIAEEMCGLTWGGDWDPKGSHPPTRGQIEDKPHFQLPNWKEVARSYGWPV